MEGLGIRGDGEDRGMAARKGNEEGFECGKMEGRFEEYVVEKENL